MFNVNDIVICITDVPDKWNIKKNKKYKIKSINYDNYTIKLYNVSGNYFTWRFKKIPIQLELEF
jgi:hypothetical protein